EKKVDQINSSLLSNRRIDGRIFSYGRYLSIFKGVGYPLDVAKMHGIDRTDSKFANLWIAHTRQPTNSPGSSPIWSHPFASFDCAIVHNGDISSFGANMELLNSLGYRSHVGTDSEVIAKLLNHLIRVEGLSVTEAATVLTNPFEDKIRGDSLQSILSKYKGAKLDGPFAVVAGYEDDQDTYLIALTDRSKFRPLLLGEDENCYYVASEENQIRGISPKARVWTPDPGSFFIASMKRGLIASGTSRTPSLEIESKVLSTNDGEYAARSKAENNSGISNSTWIDSTGMGFQEINERILEASEGGAEKISFSNLSGQRYIGIGYSKKKDSPPIKIELSGFPGNCLANLNDGGCFEIFGNVSDDLGDTMHSGSIVVHGSARDVVGQALQGGEIYVRGSVGNRAAIQMREYKNQRPLLIVGETADDYLGEYMAGGVVIILNLSGQPRSVGSFVGTGMVGGSIYIRGKVDETQIGLPPKKADIFNYLRGCELDGTISKETFLKISKLDFPSERKLAEILPPQIFKRLKNLFFRGKYTKPMEIEYRKIDSNRDALMELEPKIRNFFRHFKVSGYDTESILNSEYTVIRTIEEEKEMPIPAQEVPIEE
ncbi:MAG: glutamate synthase, partial [Thaumarchaeota archaeon]|nr:glutamate synthase [Nitrososphaerota archaeon]